MPKIITKEKEKEMPPYPDRELIKKLRRKFLEHTAESLTKDEIIDLINHQHELIRDLDRKIENNFPLIK